MDLFINNLKKKKENIDDNLFRTVARIMEESIDFSQNFIRENLGVSSVSLREIKKFFIIFEYLIDFLPKLNELDINLRDVKDISEKSSNSQKNMKIFSLINLN